MRPAKKARKGAPTPEAAAPPPVALPVADGPTLIRCRRVDAVYSVEEHRSCPYCFGKESEIATGDHTKFCDFKPGVDPIRFGFPDGFGRLRDG
jgi:hypothetical protein